MRKKANRNAQNKVQEIGFWELELRKNCNKMPGVTGGALLGVCNAEWATPRSVKDGIKYLVNG